MWGLSIADVGGVVAFTLLTYWLGLLALGGVLLSVSPLAIPDALQLPLIPLASTRPIGALLLVGLVAATSVSAAMVIVGLICTGCCWLIATRPHLRSH